MAKNEAGGRRVDHIPPAWEKPTRPPTVLSWAILRDTPNVRAQHMEPGTVVQLCDVDARHAVVGAWQGAFYKTRATLDWRIDIDWCEAQDCYRLAVPRMDVSHRASYSKAANKAVAQLEECPVCRLSHRVSDSRLIKVGGRQVAVCASCATCRPEFDAGPITARAAA